MIFNITKMVYESGTTFVLFLLRNPPFLVDESFHFDIDVACWDT